MRTGLVYLRPLSVVCVRTLGPYTTSSHEAWRQMFAWLDDSGMRRDVGCGYGLMRDNPQTTSPEQCRYEACVELIPGFENTVPGGFHFIRLPGGAYARQRQMGMNSLGAAIAELRDGWVSSNGVALDAKRPFVQIHLDDPARVLEGQLRTDLCVPIIAAANGIRSTAA